MSSGWKCRGLEKVEGVGSMIFDMIDHEPLQESSLQRELNQEELADQNLGVYQKQNTTIFLSSHWNTFII